MLADGARKLHFGGNDVWEALERLEIEAGRPGSRPTASSNWRRRLIEQAGYFSLQQVPLRRPNRSEPKRLQITVRGSQWKQHFGLRMQRAWPNWKCQSNL